MDDLPDWADNTLWELGPKWEYCEIVGLWEAGDSWAYFAQTTDEGIVSIRSISLIQLLNQLGDEGWELVSALASNDLILDREEYKETYILKRPKRPK